jgi:hypothetical protein
LRFLIVNTDYGGYLEWLYARNPELESCSYETQLRARYDTLFGVSDFYSSNLRTLGVEAYDLYANNQHLQQAWAREHGQTVEADVHVSSKSSLINKVRGSLERSPLCAVKPLIRPFYRERKRTQSCWEERILVGQIKHYRPDVVINQDMYVLTSKFWKEMKPYYRLLVGQIASPLPEQEDFRAYDVVLSSLPNLVQYFKSHGVCSELHRLAFEPKVLERICGMGGDKQDIMLSFVGSFTRDHEARARLLELLSQRADLQVWGRGIETFPPESALKRAYRGQAWGIEMYGVLKRSRVTVNHHIDVAAGYSNNMRLYESTGVGAMLVTDWKANLHELFEPGKEVAAYRTPEECAELVEYYATHDDERQAIARAGQKRTLRDHTYHQRMQELMVCVQRYL